MEIAFDHNLEQIEKEIIDYFLQYSLFVGQKPSFVKIKLYFITRKSLTQEKLTELTGLSRGTISQELKKLVEMNVIEKQSIEGSKETLYVMPSVVRAFVHFFIDSQREIKEVIEDMKDMKAEIDNEINELEDLHGFNKIYEIASLFSNIFPFVNELIKKFEKELEKIN